MSALAAVLTLLTVIDLSVAAPIPSDQFLLLVSFDGFRWDYLDMVKSRGKQTPNFDFLIRNGAQADYVKNAFVTTTWPNHWTIATGMHVESHGIVSNAFYDPVLDDFYDSPNTPYPKFYNNGTEGGGGEPIWVTYEKSGGVSGSAVWPASTIPVNGKVPTYALSQDNEGIMDHTRVDAIIEWFTQKEAPARLGLLYFDEPDDSGHDYGPLSNETVNKIVEMDGVMGYLLQQLTEQKLLHRTNLIVTSDHGMTDMIETVPLDKYVNPEWYMLSGETPTLMFLPTEGHEEDLVAALRSVPHTRLYRKEEMPPEYFYTYNVRILPYILVSDFGYRTCCYNGSAPKSTVADHGYNNSIPSMHPFFIAHGPIFKSGYQSPAFNNTAIYPLMCHLLDIEPHPNNGSLEEIKQLLIHDGKVFSYEAAKPNTPSKLVNFSKSALGFIIMFGLGTVILVLYFTVLKRKRPSSLSPPSLVVGGRTYVRFEEPEPLLNEESSEEEWEPLRARAERHVTRV